MRPGCSRTVSAPRTTGGNLAPIGAILPTVLENLLARARKHEAGETGPPDRPASAEVATEALRPAAFT